MKSIFIYPLFRKSLVTLSWTILLMAGIAQANTIIVTSTADSGAGTLRNALASAANGDTIDATGVAGTILLTSGELLVSSSVKIVGPGAANLGVDMSTPNNVFHVAPGQTVAISGLTITQGSTGIFNDQGNVTVTGCVINSNANGGIQNDGGTLTVNGCVISGNQTGLGGGGIANFGYAGTSTAAVANCIISNNVAQNVSGDTFGGGIYNDGTGGSASLSISNCTIVGNMANPNNVNVFSGNACGGGVANYASNGVATVTIANSTISGNSIDAINGTALKALGGGIYNGGTGVMTVSGATISNNSASNDYGPGEQTAAGGGGIYNNGSDGGATTMTVTNSTVTGNQVEAGNFGRSHGGGIFNDGSNGRADLTVGNSDVNTNSTVSDILDTGGGIKNSVDESDLGDGGYADVTLNNCQLIGNSVSKQYGSAIDNQSIFGPLATMDLINCTVN
ncbi:MAG TPA: hypothetical protein VGJ73_23855, partial [Verrucomicrobiae bacterium]